MALDDSTPCSASIWLHMGVHELRRALPTHRRKEFLSGVFDQVFVGIDPTGPERCERPMQNCTGNLSGSVRRGSWLSGFST